MMAQPEMTSPTALFAGMNGGLGRRARVVDFLAAADQPCVLCSEIVLCSRIAGCRDVTRCVCFTHPAFSLVPLEGLRPRATTCSSPAAVYPCRFDPRAAGNAARRGLANRFTCSTNPSNSNRSAVERNLPAPAGEATPRVAHAGSYPTRFDRDHDGTARPWRRPTRLAAGQSLAQRLSGPAAIPVSICEAETHAFLVEWGRSPGADFYRSPDARDSCSRVGHGRQSAHRSG